MTDNVKIAVAYGDGIGPEIMEATLKILKESGARISFEVIEIGKVMYERGYPSGIPEEAWKTIHSNKIILKAPITTPQGGGYKSLNVTLRKTLGLYSNVRPCVAYPPYVETMHPNIDLAIIRENEEDLYAGIEYRHTHDSYVAHKLITRSGSEQIIRYAFDYAVKNNRKKVSCLSKDNIMKLVDGIFHKVFDEVAKEYPQIQTEHYIVDIGTARLASRPDIFDVIVTQNLYGDIISDVVAEVSGSVGLAGSANIGDEYALFEAIHGSAPDISGKNIANPSGLVNAAIMMLVHIGQGDIANKIQNAWLKTIEDGVHTGDIYSEKYSKQKVGTAEFADNVIARLGQKPLQMKQSSYSESPAQTKKEARKIVLNTSEKKNLVGVDISINWLEGDQDILAEKINKLVESANLGLKLISCKGLKVWPKEYGQALVRHDLWRLRFIARNSDKIAHHADIIDLLERLKVANFDFVNSENLYFFNDKLGYTLAQGE